MDESTLDDSVVSFFAYCSNLELSCCHVKTSFYNHFSFPFESSLSTNVFSETFFAGNIRKYHAE